MIVYRIMSDDEYKNWKSSGVRGLFIKKGKTKKMLWFALDIAYIGTILMRKMYNNRLVGEAYTKIVVFGMELKREIEVKMKPENGFITIGIGAKYMDDIELKELGYHDVDWYMSIFLKRDIKPMMYYWNRNDVGSVCVTTKQVKNIIRNGNLKNRAWFMRADIYGKYMKR